MTLIKIERNKHEINLIDAYQWDEFSSERNVHINSLGNRIN